MFSGLTDFIIEILKKLGSILYRLSARKLKIKRQIDQYRTQMSERPVGVPWRRGTIRVINPGDFRDVVFVRNMDIAEAIDTQKNVEQLQDELVETWAPILILGKAGIGKTTFCDILSKRLATQQNANILLPIPIKLPNLTSHQINDILSYMIPEFEMNLQDIVNEFKGRKIKLVIFFDGLNEISEEQRFRLITKIMGISRGINNINIVATSRSIGISERLCDLFGKELKIYEMQKWTVDSVRKYLRQNISEAAVEAVESLTDNDLEVLRLPLLASLYVGSDSHDSDQTFSRVHLFDDFLRVASQDEDFERLMQTLAFEMTKNEHTVVKGYFIKGFANDDEEFARFCHLMIDEAVLYIHEYVSVATDISARDLIGLSFKFYHQSIQEHLAAKYLLDNAANWNGAPRHLSTNPFWHQIPICAMGIMKSYDSAHEHEIVDKMLERESFQMAALLADTINNANQRTRTKDIIHDKVLENLKEMHAYAYAAKTFETLGIRSSEKLLATILESETLSSIIAVPEFHLFPTEMTELVANTYDNKEESIEREWRRLGRVITILGELGNEDLVKYLLRKLPELTSLHLRYHSLESILLIVQTKENPLLFKSVADKLNTARWLQNEDDIIRAYAWRLVSFDGNREAKSLPKIAQDLAKFLHKELGDVDNPHFCDTFWRRAHGFIALAEVASPAEMLTVSEYGLEIESDPERTPYPNDGFQGYDAVLPAIVTGLLRMHRREALVFDQIQAIVEKMMHSERFAEGPWACAKLEDLLIKVLKEDDAHSWIRSIFDDELPEGTMKILDYQKARYSIT